MIISVYSHLVCCYIPSSGTENKKIRNVDRNVATPPLYSLASLPVLLAWLHSLLSIAVFRKLTAKPNITFNLKKRKRKRNVFPSS